MARFTNERCVQRGGEGLARYTRVCLYNVLKCEPDTFAWLIHIFRSCTWYMRSNTNSIKYPPGPDRAESEYNY